MIKKLKNKREFLFFDKITGKIISGKRYSGSERIFINDDNFLHNDIGPACRYKKKPGNWFWNGIEIV